MILLDTNQLEYAQPPDGPLLAMLQTLARQTRHDLGLPEIAFEEHLTHYRRTLDLAVEKRRLATAELRRRVRSTQIDDAALDIEMAVKDHSARLQAVFQIVSTPEWASRESLLREARRQPPAKVSGDGPGAGARDVAIWLTAIAACQESEEPTYFVSADNAAFGRTLKPELLADLDGLLGDRASVFHYCNSLDALLGELATKLDVVPDQAIIADSEPVRAAMKAVLDDPMLIFELPIGPYAGAVSIDTDSLQLTRAGGPNVCYQIGGTTWACVRPTWQAHMQFEGISYGPDGRLEIDDPIDAAFRIVTTLVLKLDSDGSISSAEVTGRSRAFGSGEQAAGR